MCRKLSCCVALLVTLAQLFEPTAGEAVVVNSQNVMEVANSNELVLLIFYAERCRYSMQLLPIFEETAQQLGTRFDGANRVTLGKVDCAKEPNLESRFDIGKYPTIKIVRHGYVRRSEYRGQRSVEAILNFVMQELIHRINQFDTMDELHGVVGEKFLIIGYFDSKDHPEYDNYRQAADNINSCEFHVTFNKYLKSQYSPAKNTIIFRRDLAVDHENFNAEYTGDMNSFTELLGWLQQKCHQPVRVLTFDNAEEIAEEGRPFVILFHSGSDAQSPLEFERIVETELMTEMDKVNFLTADGNQFAHPLYHLGKSEADLPLIAIDSFVHMYVFPDYKDIHKPGQLKQFIQNLHSGELHWTYHFGEILDALASQEIKAEISEEVSEASEKVSENVGEEVNKPLASSTKPPKSKFKELMPSKHRYTFVREEL